MFRKTFFITVILLIISNLVFADVTITRDDGEYREVEYYQGKKSATVFQEGSQIFNFSARKAIHTNTEKKVYCEATLEEYKQAMKEYLEEAQERRIQAMMKQTGKSREEVIEMQEKQMEMMQGMMGNMEQKNESMEITTEKGASKKIAGYSSDQYIIKNHDRKVAEIWISEEVMELIKKEPGTQTFAEIEAYGKEMQKIWEDAMRKSGMDPEKMNDPIDEAVEKLEEKGYIMQEEDFDFMFGGMMEGMGEEYEMEEELTITKDAIDNSVFQAPADYQKITVKEFFIMEEGGDEEYTEEEQEFMSNIYGAMSDENEMDINDIKVCSGIDWNFSGDKKASAPDQLTALIKGDELGFELQDIQTCTYIPAVKVGGGKKFGVALPAKVVTSGSCLQGAVFYKNEEEFIQITLDIDEENKEKDSNILSMYKVNPRMGGEPEEIEIQGHKAVFAEVASTLGGISQKLEIFLSDEARLMIDLANIHSTNEFSINLKDWANKAIDFSAYEKPDWVK